MGFCEEGGSFIDEWSKASINALGVHVDPFVYKYGMLVYSIGRWNFHGILLKS